MTVTIHAGFDSKDFSRRPGKLVIDNPEAQEGLVSVVARGTKPVTYLNCYDVAEQVHCAFCDTHQHHNRGFTVGLEDGTIALCGNKCAERFFGKAVAKALRVDLEKRQDQQKQRAMLARTFAGIGEVKACLGAGVAEKESLGLSLICVLMRILPEHALTKLRAGHIPGVDATFLTMWKPAPLVEKIQGVIRHMEGAMQREEELSEVVLKKAMDARLRMIGWLEELNGFFTEMTRFMEAESLWYLAEFHASLPHDGSAISLKRPTHGVELHIFVPGEGISRYKVDKAGAFDGSRLLAILRGQGVDEESQSQ